MMSAEAAPLDEPPSTSSLEVKGEPFDGASSFVGNSLTGSTWTLVSRVTGLARIVVIGAVLGATYLGNTYQGINALPNLVYYQLLAGSLFVSLLVPPLVRHVREGNSERAEALVRGFLGSVLGLALVAMLALIAVGPQILHLLSLGVSDAGSAAAQRRVGLLLLVLFAPQILLYVIAGTGAAVMNAYGRFALAAAAPTIENLGMILTLVLAWIMFGSGVGLSDVSTSEVVLLGVGTTTAVALHAALQWFGARRHKITMHPGAGWRDAEIRNVLRRIRSVLAYTGLAAFQLFATIVVANRVAGGLVAFQLALNFFYLPAAVVTWPIARALVPRLADFHQMGQMRKFRDEFVRAMALTSFVAVPVAVAYALSASSIAHLVAFGRLDSPTATEYMAVSMIALSPAVIGEAWFTLGSHALYSQQNVAAPLRAMAVRVAITMLLIVPAYAAHGARVLVLIGVALSAGSFVGAVYVWRQVNSRLPATEDSLLRSLGRTAVASAIMVVPALLTWVGLAGLAGSRPGELIRLILAVVVGGATFLALQARLNAPEIALLRAGLAHFALRPRRGEV
jgi:putative peptidoglycan lipid II flippase